MALKELAEFPAEGKMNFMMLPPNRFQGGGPGMGGMFQMPQFQGGISRPQPPVQAPFGGGGMGIPRPAPPVQMPMQGYGGGFGGSQFQPGGGSGMVPLSAMRQYKNGTPYVPRTGPAILHEGEAVISAPKAKKMRKVALSSLLRLK